MKRLWAPWRLQYVTKEKPQGCIFCDKPRAGDDRANHIVHRGRDACVMLNTYPYNNGHVMIAPFAQQAGIGEKAVMGISTAFTTLGEDGFVAMNAVTNKFVTIVGGMAILGELLPAEPTLAGAPTARATTV